jgi:hypothetical protein
VSEFDKLKDQAEKEAREHPEQVSKGEQAAEKEGEQEMGKVLGMNSEAEETSQNAPNTPPQDEGT